MTPIPSEWLAVIPLGVLVFSLVLSMAAYYNELRSERDVPVKLSLIITVAALGFWLVSTVLVFVFGYLAYNLIF